MVAFITKDPETDLNEQLLHFDPLSEAEKITGKSYKESKETSLIGMALMFKNNELKDKLLSSQDDTCFNCSIENYIRIMKDLGFVPLLEESFIGTGYGDKQTVNEMFYIYWYPTKYILSCFDTFNTKDLNSSYWNFSYHPNDIELFYEKEFHCSGGWYTGSKEPPLSRSDWIWEGSWDSREAIRHQMKKFDTYGTFVKWPKPQHLFLMNYIDWKQCKDLNFSYCDKLTKIRFNNFPSYVKEAIGGSCDRD